MSEAQTVELLAPAGNMDAFLAALCGGADAVYVGGEKYGARAYAENFDENALLRAIDKAHLYQRKLYLTVNTLMKQEELDALPAYILPLYEAGLDGVIVQDLGALLVLRDIFPGLALHASTQMTVTGSGGAGLLQEYGVSRIVPARELSLDEIRTIKKETGLEMETFIHGAMCYSYSGQCLFSSMLGARSGNRGRCAGPCRLPYRAFHDGRQINDDGSLYQLSLKDLCSLEILPRLIEAGIDSFKIEGRMKQKEYVSFVTGMYRYYIDAYREDPAHYKVSARDKKELNELFLRGSVQTGYYFMHSGRELVTLEKPGYTSFSHAYTATEPVLSKYPIDGIFHASCGEPLTLTVRTEDGITAAAEAPPPGRAQNRAATDQDVRRALQKTGNTDFVFRDLKIGIDGAVFLPNGQLNALRREALFALEGKMLAPHRRDASAARRRMEAHWQTDAAPKYGKADAAKPVSLTVSLQTIEQLEALSPQPFVSRLILSFDCFEEICAADAAKKDACRRILKERQESRVQIGLSLPAVLRTDGVRLLQKLDKEIRSFAFDFFLLNNPEGLAWARANFPGMRLLSDHRFYLFQAQSLAFFAKCGITEHFISYELHEKEIAALVSSPPAQGHTFCMPIYGHIPLMETAGCILKTNGCCDRNPGRQTWLVDRQNKKIPVIRHCSRCENTLYNPVPLSLHRETDHIKSTGIRDFHLMFTVETGGQMNAVISWFDRLLNTEEEAQKKKLLTEEIPFSQFTKGHLAKGVE